MTSSGRTTRSLWRCVRCRRRFANRNQSHSCGPGKPLAAHFSGKPASVKSLFETLRSAVEAFGPVEVLSEKSRIAFQARMSFMAISVQRSGLKGHFVFASVRRHRRLFRVDSLSRKNHVHHFRLTQPADVDAAFRSWIAEAYRVGQQRHLAGHGEP